MGITENEKRLETMNTREREASYLLLRIQPFRPLLHSF